MPENMTPQQEGSPQPTDSKDFLRELYSGTEPAERTTSSVNEDGRNQAARVAHERGRQQQLQDQLRARQSHATPAVVEPSARTSGSVAGAGNSDFELQSGDGNKGLRARLGEAGVKLKGWWEKARSVNARNYELRNEGAVQAEIPVRSVRREERRDLSTGRSRMYLASEQDLLLIDSIPDFSLFPRNIPSSENGSSISTSENAPIIPSNPEEVINYAQKEMAKLRSSNYSYKGHDWSGQIKFPSKAGYGGKNIVDDLPEYIATRWVILEYGGRKYKLGFKDALQSWIDAEGRLDSRYKDEQKSAPSIDSYTQAMGMQQLTDQDYFFLTNPLATNKEESDIHANSLTRAFLVYKNLLVEQPAELIDIYNRLRRAKGEGTVSRLPNIFTGGGANSMELGDVRTAVREYSSSRDLHVGIVTEDMAIRLIRMWKVNSQLDTNISGVGGTLYGDDMVKAMYFGKWRRSERIKGNLSGPPETLQEGAYPENLLLNFLERTKIHGDTTLEEFLESGGLIADIPWYTLEGDQKPDEGDRVFGVDGSYLLALQRTATLALKLISMDLRKTTSVDDLLATNKLISSVITPELLRKIETGSVSTHMNKEDEIRLLALLRTQIKWNYCAGIINMGLTPGQGDIDLTSGTVTPIVSRIISAQFLPTSGTFAAHKLRQKVHELTPKRKIVKWQSLRT